MAGQGWLRSTLSYLESLNVHTVLSSDLPYKNDNISFYRRGSFSK